MKKVYIVISIDTECDKDNNWEIPQPMQFRNIPLQKIFFNSLYEKYEIKPTYLLSPEILKDDKSIHFFKNFKNIELGTHLHEEFIEPDMNMQAIRTKNIQADLSYEVEKLKLKNLTNLFTEKIGYAPKSFRAGRFGYSKHTFDILTNLGYRVDSSVTPFKTNYFSSGYVTNGWGKKIEPYFCSTDKKLLQVPVSIINRDYHHLPPFILKKLETKGDVVLKKMFRKLGFKSRSEWLRPYRANAEELLSISEYIIQCHFKNIDFSLLNIMFHSNEILEKASPYCQTREEVKSFIDSLDFLFSKLTEKYELCFIGLGDVYKLYSHE